MATTYEGIYSQNNWTWSTIGTGMVGRHIYDIACARTYDALAAGTDDGIYTYTGGYWLRRLFGGEDVLCMEALSREDEFWAATGGAVGDRKLVYSDHENLWTDYEEIKPQTPQSFGKLVNDIAAIFVTTAQYGLYQSVYIATETGLYLLNIQGVMSPLTMTEYIDFQDPDCPYETPFEYDTCIRSLDYYQSSSKSASRDILVGTKRAVYLLTETRSDDRKHIVGITCTNISDGTFWTDEARAAFGE
jgi:hypothetical protein